MEFAAMRADKLLLAKGVEVDTFERETLSEQFPEIFRGSGARILAGPVGSGKTHRIAREYHEGMKRLGEPHIDVYMLDRSELIWRPVHGYSNISAILIDDVHYALAIAEMVELGRKKGAQITYGEIIDALEELHDIGERMGIPVITVSDTGMYGMVASARDRNGDPIKDAQSGLASMFKGCVVYPDDSTEHSRRFGTMSPVGQNGGVMRDETDYAMRYNMKCQLEIHDLPVSMDTAMTFSKNWPRDYRSWYVCKDDEFTVLEGVTHEPSLRRMAAVRRTEKGQYWNSALTPVGTVRGFAALEDALNCRPNRLSLAETSDLEIGREMRQGVIFSPAEIEELNDFLEWLVIDQTAQRVGRWSAEFYKAEKVAEQRKMLLGAYIASQE